MMRECGGDCRCSVEIIVAARCLLVAFSGVHQPGVPEVTLGTLWRRAWYVHTCHHRWGVRARSVVATVALGNSRTAKRSLFDGQSRSSVRSQLRFPAHNDTMRADEWKSSPCSLMTMCREASLLEAKCQCIVPEGAIEVDYNFRQMYVQAYSLQGFLSERR